MRLTILGSGTYQPELERHGSAYLVETKKSKICFDFGRGAIDQLLKVGVHVNQIDAIFISHWHPDHVSDLLPLLHITIAAPADLTVDWIPRQKPLRIYGPKGTQKQLNYLRKAGYLYDREMKEVEVYEIKRGAIKGVDWTIKPYLTKHNPEVTSLCYRLETERKILAYSGDTTVTEGLNKTVQGADLAIIEAGWPEKVNPQSHMTGQRAGKVAQATHVQKLVITHVSPYYMKGFNPLEDVQKYFQGEVIMARDLMEIEI